MRISELIKELELINKASPEDCEVYLEYIDDGEITLEEIGSVSPKTKIFYKNRTRRSKQIAILSVFSPTGDVG